MRRLLLLILAVTSTCFSQSPPYHLQNQPIIPPDQSIINELTAIINTDIAPPTFTLKPLNEIKAMLHNEAATLHGPIINKVLSTLSCASKYNIENNHILTIIDYSLPSSEKRLWVFDLNEMKLLFHTYVSHGIKSGTLLSRYFSNKNNSKSSSIGVYKTEKTYYGRDGLSLRLDGLEQGFNNNASNRSVVMHGGWYVDETFIKKYGRAGRSWGCPALPMNLTESIINTIKDNALFVVYYPSDSWFLKSKFLNCNRVGSTPKINTLEIKPIVNDDGQLREAILFAQIGKNKYHGDSDPIVAMTADNYTRIFRIKAPLARMLRRQISQTEYIALSNAEFRYLAAHNLNSNDDLNAVCFVMPVLKMRRGYVATDMQLIPLGKIKDVTFDLASSEKAAQATSITVHFEAKPSVNLRSTNQFIRWLGL